MNTVFYPYTGKRSVKNNEEARARAKRELGKDVLIDHISWEHDDGDTRCAVVYLTPAEAAAHDRAPIARVSVRRNGCRPADVHNALLEMGGEASIHDIALALDVDVQWLTKQMEHPAWLDETGGQGVFAGELTQLSLDPATAVPVEAVPASRRRLRAKPGVLVAAVARSVMHSS